MRSDNEIELAGFEIADDSLLLFRSDEPAQHLDGHREGGKAFFEGFKVLIAKNRCRRQHRNLLSVANSLEGGAHGNLGFTVTDITANEAIHRQRRLHVTLDVCDGSYLIGSLFVLKRLFELLLPLRIRRK